MSTCSYLLTFPSCLSVICSKWPTVTMRIIQFKNNPLKCLRAGGWQRFQFQQLCLLISAHQATLPRSLGKSCSPSEPLSLADWCRKRGNYNNQTPWLMEPLDITDKIRLGERQASLDKFQQSVSIHRIAATNLCTHHCAVSDPDVNEAKIGPIPAMPSQQSCGQTRGIIPLNGTPREVAPQTAQRLWRPWAAHISSCCSKTWHSHETGPSPWPVQDSWKHEGQCSCIVGVPFMPSHQIDRLVLLKASQATSLPLCLHG